MRESETKLKTDCSREKASSAQLRDLLSRERTSNQQLASQVEQLSGRLRESTRLESELSQHSTEQLQVRAVTVCLCVGTIFPVVACMAYRVFKKKFFAVHI